MLLHKVLITKKLVSFCVCHHVDHTKSRKPETEIDDHQIDTVPLKTSYGGKNVTSDKNFVQLLNEFYFHFLFKPLVFLLCDSF